MFGPVGVQHFQVHIFSISCFLFDQPLRPSRHTSYCKCSVELLVISYGVQVFDKILKVHVFKGTKLKLFFRYINGHVYNITIILMWTYLRRWNRIWDSPRCSNWHWQSIKRSIYNSTQNTRLIRELDLNLVLWKQTALSRACFKSRQKSLLRRLYQRIFIQAAKVHWIKRQVVLCF